MWRVKEKRILSTYNVYPQRERKVIDCVQEAKTGGDLKKAVVSDQEQALRK